MSKAGERRSLLCPRCDRPIEVSKLTKSTLCSGCHRTMRTEDETVSDYQARAEYFNEARVEVARKGVIISEVRVRALVVKGEVKGPIRAREEVRIHKTGKIYGNVVARSLAVEEGAILVGRVEVGPLRKIEPAPPAGVTVVAAAKSTSAGKSTHAQAV
ncbi:MAG TPA: polymer-forming cytoskeletal protein [Planctomycetota bacterium]|jgi:bactofilin|nr:polymer-forming cytoskeletal protein [Planctomycetota bacterium]